MACPATKVLWTTLWSSGSVSSIAWLSCRTFPFCRLLLCSNKPCLWEPRIYRTPHDKNRTVRYLSFIIYVMTKLFTCFIVLPGKNLIPPFSSSVLSTAIHTVTSLRGRIPQYFKSWCHATNLAFSVSSWSMLGGYLHTIAVESNTRSSENIFYPKTIIAIIWWNLKSLCIVIFMNHVILMNYKKYTPWESW